MFYRPITRREFLVLSAKITALVGCVPWWFNACSWFGLKSRARKGNLLTLKQWQTAEALARVLIPPDDIDWVVEADVVNYIDTALTTKPRKKYKSPFFWGLANLDKEAKRLHRTTFAKLSSSKQNETLQNLLNKNFRKFSAGKTFVQVALVLVLEGLLGDPVYGGNKDLVGWKMIGFQQYCMRPPAPYGQ